MAELPRGHSLKAVIRITGMSMLDFSKFLDSVGLVMEIKTDHRSRPIIGYVTSPDDGRAIGKVYPATPHVPVTVELEADQISMSDFERIMGMIEAIGG